MYSKRYMEIFIIFYLPGIELLRMKMTNAYIKYFKNKVKKT